MPKVLIAEDYMFNYLLLQRFLKKLNYEFVVCDNGQKALEELKKQDFDIVLMDIEMPVMDGIEAVRHIRADFTGQKQEIPIIALTGHHEDDYFGNLNKVGFNDCLMKPIDLNVLENKLNQYIKAIDLIVKEKESKKFNVDKELQLDYLYEFADGDNTFVREMIDLFVKNAPDFIENMKEGFKKNDWEKLRYNAHKFSPQLAFFGLNTIIEEVDSIEEYAVKKVFADLIEDKIINIEINCKIALEKLSNITI